MEIFVVFDVDDSIADEEAFDGGGEGVLDF